MTKRKRVLSFLMLNAPRRKTLLFAVIDKKAKRKRQGKVSWKGRYVFTPHPKARISKAEEDQIEIFCDKLNEARKK